MAVESGRASPIPAHRTDHRREIDGLRAWAVLPVVAFHAGMPGFGGGWVGVDVFFVLSGYLISRILLDGLSTGRFGYLTFYERRARRILPAYLAMLAGVSVAGALTMAPARFEALADAGLASLLFASNLWFWLQSGYFEPVAELSPLLHTWSLGVEEQFYLLYPLLLAWAYERRCSHTAILLVTIVSLGLAEWASRSSPSASFFLAPFRAWELGCGALLAIAEARRPARRLSRGIASALAACGLLLIGLAVTLFDEDTRVPGLPALVPVLGTIAVLVGTRDESVVRGMLSARPLVAVGLISYSLYLWHQPTLAFVRLHHGAETTPAHLAAAVLAAFALATASFFLVERPFRVPRRVPTRRMGALIGGSSLLLGICLASASFGGWQPQALPQGAAAALLRADRGEFRDGAWRLVDARRRTPPPENAIVVVGDSHARDVYNALVLGDCPNAHRIYPLVSQRECGVASTDSEAYRRCAFSLAFADAWVDRADAVIVAPAWGPRSLPYVKGAMARVRGWDRPTMLLHKGPVFEEVLTEAQRLVGSGVAIEAAGRRVAATLDALPAREARAVLDEGWLPAAVVDRLALVCAADDCPVLSSAGVPYYYDRTHWTLAGAAEFGRRFCADPTVVAFLEEA